MFKFVDGMQLSIERESFKFGELLTQNTSRPSVERKADAEPLFRHFDWFQGLILEPNQWVQFDSMSKNGWFSYIKVTDNNLVEAIYSNNAQGFYIPDGVRQIPAINDSGNYVYASSDGEKRASIDGRDFTLDVPDGGFAYGFVLSNNNRIFGQIYGEKIRGFAEWNQKGSYKILETPHGFEVSAYFKNSLLTNGRITCLLEDTATGAFVPGVADFDDANVRVIPLEADKAYGVNFKADSNAEGGTVISSIIIEKGEPVGLYYWEHGDRKADQFRVRSNRVFVDDCSKDDAFIGREYDGNGDPIGQYHDNRRFSDKFIDFQSDLVGSYHDMNWCVGDFISRNGTLVGICDFGGASPHKSFFFGKLKI